MQPEDQKNSEDLSLLLLAITQKADLRDFHIRFIFQKQKLHTFLYVQFMTAASRIGSVS